MRYTLILALSLLAGCSSTKLGAICYLPAGMVGACVIVPPDVLKGDAL